MAVTFKGFSSPVVGNTQVLYDADLIKQDLINHFYTKKGERVMDTDYGFVAWDLLFELDRPGNAQLLEQDARRILSQDPRVQELSINVQSTEYGYAMTLTINFVQLNKIDDLYLVFDQRSRARMA